MPVINIIKFKQPKFATGFTPLNPARPVRLSRNLTGFTLIEMIVSVAIIGSMSAIFLVNYHATNKRSELGMVKQKLASDIRLAQNYTLGAKEYEANKTPSGGWGAHFNINEPTKYIIFADKETPNGDKIYQADEAIETKTLPAGVIIEALSAAGSSVNALDIVFFPPDPITYINNNLNNTSAQITLKENINNSTAIISVNFFGLIDTD